MNKIIFYTYPNSDSLGVSYFLKDKTLYDSGSEAEKATRIIILELNEDYEKNQAWWSSRICGN